MVINRKIQIQVLYNRDSLLFWYINKRYITQTKGIHSIDIEPENGINDITVVSEYGNRKSIKVFFVNN